MDRSGKYVGRPAIKAFVDSINVENPDRDTLHFCANSVIALNGDTAEAHTDIVFVSRPNNPTGAWSVGSINHYTDQLVRHGSQWFFQDRRIDRRPTVRTPLSELSVGSPLGEHEEIRRVLALYAQMVDSKDAIGWSEQFAANGTFHTRKGDHTGRAAIKQFIEQQFANEPSDRNTAHLGTNLVISRRRGQRSGRDRRSGVREVRRAAVDRAAGESFTRSAGPRGRYLALHLEGSLTQTRLLLLYTT